MVSAVNVTWFSSIPNNKRTDAWITYNSTSKNLSVVFTGFQQQGNTTVIRKVQEDEDEDDDIIDGSMNNEFERSTRPKKFLYSELVRCTNNFSWEEMLGQGGFGGFYKGYLSESNSYIAVKRVSRESKELLLVYEFMPNESLDYHLFKGRSHLTWPIRFKIAQGLASALLYLHEEWELCVVHRDIKSSNIMLDSNFNAKLGDFGLARLGKGCQTTILAGTMGYMAPECVTTGKASKETDVYSFGVVVLEIGCGRKSIEHKAEEHQVNIIEWVWRLYGMGNLREAVDPRFSLEFNEQEVDH
ncbi:hypothetical protein KY290_003580 [Solanum tuberosum]|uniref:Protein kinase domain-containing protein n=1 Tax=Solanum tuberosum TaxID=4113 RepID=A0ABQ7WT94_SOLTU|nr:hypothetical protein KY290_003580 [Solanum tuberosum]